METSRITSSPSSSSNFSSSDGYDSKKQFSPKIRNSESFYCCDSVNLPLLKIQSPNGNRVFCSFQHNPPLLKARSLMDLREWRTLPSSDSLQDNASLLRIETPRKNRYSASFKDSLPPPNTQSGKGTKHPDSSKGHLPPLREKSYLVSTNSKMNHRPLTSRRSLNFDDRPRRLIIRPQFRMQMDLDKCLQSESKVTSSRHIPMISENCDSTVASSFSGYGIFSSSFANLQNPNVTPQIYSPVEEKCLPAVISQETGIISSTPIKF